MSRQMHRRLLGALLSAALVAGLVPAPALAELAGEEPAVEAAQGGGQAFAEEAAGDEGEQPEAADAQADDGGMVSKDSIASGTWGTCPWEISDDGALTVHPGTGAGTGGKCPWSSYASSITSVTFAVEGGQKVVAPANCSYLFRSLSNVTSVDASGLNTSAVTSMSGMFRDCSSLDSLELSGWDTSSVTDISYMFNGCSSLESVDGISGWDTSGVTNMSAVFIGCSKLASLDLSDWVTSGVTNMSSMVRECSSLASLDLSGWDTSSVTDMKYMFFNCSSLASLDLSGWVTSGVTTMSNMFSGCSSLASIGGLSGWDTSSVTDMSSVFSSCSSLASLDLSGWVTSGVTTMSSMFYNCSSLASLDPSGWDTSKVTTMSYVFYNCSSLASLDLSGWDTSSVTTTSGMFYKCSGLGTVYVGDSWSTDAVTSSSTMFTGCTSIVGGAGTTYDSGHTNKAYAHVDGGESDPGYLTLKAAPAQTFYYKAADGTATQITSPVTVVDAGTTFKADGWYVVEGEDVQIECDSEGFAVGADAKLVLLDGAKLTISGYTGLVVDEGKALTVYAGDADGDIEGSGRLETSAYYMGVGNYGTLTVNGGTLKTTANLMGVYNESIGSITVTGGTMVAHGGSQAICSNGTIVADGMGLFSSADGESWTAEDSIAALTDWNLKHAKITDAVTTYYTVTFVNEDGVTVLKEATEYEEGTAGTAIALPDEPTKQATAQYTYAFAGWSDGENTYASADLPAVTADVTYRATYTETARPNEIVTDPADATAAVGDHFTLAVEATGNVASYQWLHSRDGGATWKNVQWDGNDAASLSYRMNADIDGRQFKCVVTFTDGTTDTSEVATVSLPTPSGRITTQPADATTPVGDRFTLAIVAEDAASYSWQNSKSGTSWSDVTWKGHDTATLSYKMTEGLDGRRFRCVVTFADGATEVSEVATVSLPEPSGRITTQPADASAAADERFTLTVAAEGARSYSWQHSKTGSSWSDVAWRGHDTATLSYRMSASLDGRMFRCVVTFADGATEVSDVATVTLAATPV